MPKLSAQQVAQIVGGQLLGSPDVTVSNVRSLELAGPGDLSFLRSKENKDATERCRASALISPVPLERFAGPVIICADPDAAMAPILELFATERIARPRGVSPLAYVSPSARLGRDVGVGEFAHIGDETVVGDGAVIHPLVHIGRSCRIGARTEIFAGATIHDGVTIGEDCIIHYNAVIGSEGFGFLQRGGANVKLCQVGTVRIGNRVEIGALTTVDRATLDETVIEDDVKIDNHCHIAHNCHIGPNCIMAGYSKLAGSVRLGKNVIVGEDVGINDHVTVGDGAILGASSGVHNNVKPGAVLLGTPARPIAEQRRIFAYLGRLPDIAEKLRRLEKELQDIARQLGRVTE